MTRSIEHNHAIAFQDVSDAASSTVCDEEMGPTYLFDNLMYETD